MKKTIDLHFIGTIRNSKMRNIMDPNITKTRFVLNKITLTMNIEIDSFRTQHLNLDFISDLFDLLQSKVDDQRAFLQTLYPTFAYC